jgi:hypothetical protein
MYSQRCLYDILAEDILILRYLSLGSSKYKKRSTWVIDTLQGFKIVERILQMEEHVKYFTRIKIRRIYNASYALAIGYSQSKLVDLIAEIRNSGHCASQQGNTHRQRENNNITMARVLFKQYVKEFGEPMPNRQHGG